MTVREVKPYMNGHGAVQTSCTFCGEPFPVEGNHLRAWRGQDSHLYCDSDCEEASCNGDPVPALS